MLTLLLPSFLAGVLTFFAPCSLPLMPVYFALLTGLSNQELNDPIQQRQQRRKILSNTVFFVFGFSLIFVILGLGATVLGHWLVVHQRVISRVGGILVICFALAMLLQLPLPFFRGLQPSAGYLPLEPGKRRSAFLMGILMAFAWTPCIGPVVATILFLAASSSTWTTGILLLLIFALGHALPFLLIATGYGWIMPRLKRIYKYLWIVNLLAALLLLVVGILMIFNSTGILTARVFSLFSWFNYQAILNYL